MKKYSDRQQRCPAERDACPFEGDICQRCFVFKQMFQFELLPFSALVDKCLEFIRICNMFVTKVKKCKMKQYLNGTSKAAAHIGLDLCAELFPPEEQREISEKKGTILGFLLKSKCSNARCQQLVSLWEKQTKS